MRLTTLETALALAGAALLVLAWWLTEPVPRPAMQQCPPYYECNGPPDTRHPRCCF